jgi:hypothetical protein
MGAGLRHRGAAATCRYRLHENQEHKRPIDGHAALRLLEFVGLSLFDRRP